MVMTSYLYHLLFETINESECMFLQSDTRNIKEGKRKSDETKVIRSNFTLRIQRRRDITTTL